MSWIRRIWSYQHFLPFSAIDYPLCNRSEKKDCLSLSPALVQNWKSWLESLEDSVLSSQTLHWNSSGALHIPRIAATTAQAAGQSYITLSAGVGKGEMFAKTVIDKTSIKKHLLTHQRFVFKVIVMIYYPLHRCF